MQYPAGCARRQFVHRWSVFVTPLGTARYRRAVPAPNACAVWSILPTHDHSLGIDTKAPLCKGGCRAISAAGGLSQPTSLHMLVSAQNNPSAPAGHLPLHRGGFFARYRSVYVIARPQSGRGNPRSLNLSISGRLHLGERIATPLRPQARTERNRRRRLLARSSDIGHWFAMTGF